MTQQGAALQTYNNELVKCIEELCFKRDELNKQIKQEEDEKARLQHDIRILTEKLSRVNESLARRLTARAEFDRTIAETEAAYMKSVCFLFLHSPFTDTLQKNILTRLI
uniref:Sjogren syndrome nuclear autoantigen 1 n=1 Tax=Electrophorus electricus TaxID=8005 RepID=A0A4W4F9S6_ELEEL